MDTRIFSSSDPRSLVAAAEALREGQVLALPTDTVYGLAASVFRREAVARVYELKRRPPDVRAPVLFATAADLPIVVSDIPNIAWKLIDEFWPGPLSLVLPARPSAPEWITRGGGSVAVRVPSARSTLEVLQVLGEPVLGTSANVSGEPPALTAAEALQSLPGMYGVVEDDAAVRSGISSTIVSLLGGTVTVLRPGAVSTERIRQAVGTRVEVRHALAGH